MENKGLTQLRINLASPETVRSWSYGEVIKPETINYRRLRPEKDGLFCEAIFGPSRDWQCYCGKYKNMKYKNIVCDKCGVEVTRSSVRRERMGHIDLSAPVAHVWYTRRVPSSMGLLLDIKRKDLDRVLYFAQYIVTHVDEDARQRALAKLDEDTGNLERESVENIETQISQLEETRDLRLEELSDNLASIEQSFNETIGKSLEPIMKGGQKLEKTLNGKMGKSIRKEILFPDSDVVIAKKGTTIGNQHIARVQEHVTESLNTIEAELKGQKTKEIELVNLDIAMLRAESEQKIVEYRNQIEDVSVINKNEYQRKRDELLDLQPLSFMGEPRYRELRSRWGQVFRADMGAEAFYDILKRIDLAQLSIDLWEIVRTSKSKQKRSRASKRLKIVENLIRSGNKPEWMIMTVIPVIPPDLRPMVQLDGGRFATSDLNDLYRRVINRNNRLKRLLELGAPDVIVRNEKRMLQEAVDSLIDNAQRGKAKSRRGRRELKSLSDLLKGKKGRFRRNLLGKRVDYSGRSVIVVGPKLKIHQCGLPKSMALELYRPFVISGLVNRNYAANVRGARRLIERNRPEVYEVLEDVIKDRPVLLNRAPTLHRLGIQAFEPVLIEGSAIQLHPLVTTAFNADFDGDQMAVHVPLSMQAVKESRELMLASKNLLKPSDGEPIIGPSKDMVLGVYYLTKDDEREFRGEGRIFASTNEVEMAYSLDQVEIPTGIKILAETWYGDDGKRLEKAETRLIETTVGRVLFNRILPPEVQFINFTLEKKGVRDLIREIYEICGEELTTISADRIKDIGFEYATKSGYSIAVADIMIPPSKPEIIAEALEEVELVQRDYARGLLTDIEKEEKEVNIWKATTERVSDAVSEYMDPHGNLAAMAKSGATKGGFKQLAQLAGMRGLMADPSGRTIPLPIRSNFREGLTALEYFISTHGARKGLADTALRTANAGYLTRRLVDVAQDLIINSKDCGTDNGIYIRRSDNVANQNWETRLFSRVTAENVIDPLTGELLLEKGKLLDRDIARVIVASTCDRVYVYSALTCELERGICAKCYGFDLGRGKMVEIGSAVGIVAAQSIGEPGTQLTLRTFHTGGVATASDITTGLPRVEELFEARKLPKGEAVMAEIAGIVEVTFSDKYSDLRVVKVTDAKMISDEYPIAKEWKIQVKDATDVHEGEVIATHPEAGKIVAEHAGKARIEGTTVIISHQDTLDEEYDIPSSSRLLVKTGDKVEPGEPLTEGSLNPHNILRINGREACQMYLMKEVQYVYGNQGQNIHDKHFEVIIRRMMSKVSITSPGDSTYLPIDFVNRYEVRAINEELIAEGKRPAKYNDLLLGITKASLNTESFLSAASFQHTIKVLSNAALAGAVDPLIGLKENVIIGRLIPAGTGFRFGPFAEVEDEQELVEELPLVAFDEYQPIIKPVVVDIEEPISEKG